ncbi:L-aspartate oxidase [Piscibacillus halophilus]|uniref:L-aspartate oxidase n=1 Tax=Piscibacillus halophilus TaxID=571933 RepID=UPI002409E778|nr:L-aspartate oxidase [Piscibacillus halophilus]
MTYTDVLIIGSGLAALQLATHLDENLNVTILTKSNIKSSNSNLAQGGISAAVNTDDSPIHHASDTIKAGRYINHQDIVYEMTSQAPNIIQQLMKQGCSFDQIDQQLSLGQEGAHSHRRIVKAGGDQTGRMLVNTLISQLPDQINIIENAFVYELLHQNQKCYGVKYKDICEENHTIYSPHIVLATGGCGQLYPFTSNCKEATGDGVILAYLAGAIISDMEFIQFHPTLLYKNDKTQGLISEAVRGEGAVLVNQMGQNIMKAVHPLEHLAPRHIVAQTIYNHMKKGDRVYLDIQKIKNFADKFPSITDHCTKQGINLGSGLIPVAPGAHFMMGGVTTNIYGETNIEGLYAIGEVANNGFHGANRLASNSLLEGLVMGERLAQRINQSTSNIDFLIEKNSKSQDFKRIDLPPINGLRDQMMNRVGIVRNNNNLLKMIDWLDSLQVEKYLYADLSEHSKDDIQRIFLYNLAFLITKSALNRKESRGAHHRTDYPFEQDSLLSFHTILEFEERRKQYEYITTKKTN